MANVKNSFKSEEADYQTKQSQTLVPLILISSNFSEVKDNVYWVPLY